MNKIFWIVPTSVRLIFLAHTFVALSQVIRNQITTISMGWYWCLAEARRPSQLTRRRENNLCSLHINDDICEISFIDPDVNEFSLVNVHLLWRSRSNENWDK
jgi:hypothetical protein